MRSSLLLTILLIGPTRGADDPANLVARLGAARFADREEAARKLRAPGPKALPAVTAGCVSKDEEVSARSKVTRELIRADWRTVFAAAFEADAKEAKQKLTPGVGPVRPLAGDSRAGRALFGEMIASSENFAGWTTTADPTRAASMEVVKDCDDRRNELMKYTFHIPEWPGDRPSEHATMLFLGASFSGDPWPAKTGANTTHVPVFVAGKPLRSPAGGPIAKLFVAWLDKRSDEEVVRSGLDVVFCHALADGLPLARRIAVDTKLSPKTRAAALPVLGRLGTAADTAACTPLLGDESLFASFETGGYVARGTPTKTRTVQVQDVSAAVALALAGPTRGLRVYCRRRADLARVPDQPVRIVQHGLDVRAEAGDEQGGGEGRVAVAPGARVRDRRRPDGAHAKAKAALSR